MQRPAKSLMLGQPPARELPASLANCHRLELLRIAANRSRSSRLAAGATAPQLARLRGQPLQRQAGAPAGAVRLGGRYPVGCIEVGECWAGASGVIHRAGLEGEEGTQAVAVKLFKGP